MHAFFTASREFVVVWGCPLAIPYMYLLQPQMLHGANATPQPVIYQP